MRPEPCVVLCDLDGVVWLAHEPIRGSVEAIAALRAAGHRVLFVTNNSSATVATQEAALAHIGIPAEGDAVIERGQRVHVCGGPGIVEAVERRGGVVVNGESCDAVMVGFHRSFDFEGLTTAATLVRQGAQLIGTNDDATYPTPAGPIPGGGSILAAVRTAAGVEPTIAGKPYRPMADLVRSMVGDAAASAAVMVGDRPETDGLFARQLGCRYAIVWSGVSSPEDELAVAGDLSADNLAGIAALLL
jgi:ribonucleotide monophosphatase NagD (HAD superfamily)